jgi:hypothetical protein
MLCEALRRFVLVLAAVALVATGAIGPAVGAPTVGAPRGEGPAASAAEPPCAMSSCGLPCEGCPVGATDAAGCAGQCSSLPGAIFAAAVIVAMITAAIGETATSSGNGRSIRPSPHPPRA